MAHPSCDEDVAEYVQRVVRFVRGQFEYEPGVTQVQSTVDEILTIDGGVCQDFAHLMIGILRSGAVRFGLPRAGVQRRTFETGRRARQPRLDGSAVARTRLGRLRSDSRLPRCPAGSSRSGPDGYSGQSQSQPCGSDP